MAGIYIHNMTLDEFWEDYGEGASYLCATGRAVEIPDHGRLIDADVLLDAWDDRHTIPSKAAKVIEKTVIPADKEEEK